jgi:hypothetical protein
LSVAEEADAGAEQDGDDREREVVDQAGGEELLDDGTPVDVGAMGSVRAQSFDECAGFAGEEFFAVLAFARAAREDDAAFAGVRPGVEREREIVGAAADDERVDGVEERVLAVVSAARSTIYR